MDLYPLKFEPMGVRKVWGGRGLRLHLGKPFDWSERWGESWEVADNQHGVTVVANGPLAGKTLEWLNRHHGVELVGAPQKKAFPGRFPLIAKYLDATQLLSAQVHPDEKTARKELGESPKTEAWYIVHARKGSRIYCGTRPGVGPADMKRAFKSSRPLSCAHGFEPKAGQAILIPGRTFHAFGAGVLVAEIQQNSNTTLRLCDYGRVRHGADKKDSDLDRGLQVVDYSRGPVGPVRPPGAGRPLATLIDCDKFVMKLWRVGGRSQSDTTATGFHILMAVGGAGELVWRRERYSLCKGETILVPATAGRYRVEGQAEILLAHLPRVS